MNAQQRSRNGKLCFKEHNMTIGARNRVIKNLYRLVNTRRSFLILGHQNPDEDCYASVAACALILRKFGKHVSIFLEVPPPENLKFLNSICKYNKINIF